MDSTSCSAQKPNNTNNNSDVNDSAKKQRPNGSTPARLRTTTAATTKTQLVHDLELENDKDETMETEEDGTEPSDNKAANEERAGTDNGAKETTEPKDGRTGDYNDNDESSVDSTSHDEDEDEDKYVEIMDSQQMICALLWREENSEGESVKENSTTASPIALANPWQELTLKLHEHNKNHSGRKVFIIVKKFQNRYGKDSLVSPKRIEWLLVRLYKEGFFDNKQLCVVGSLVGRFLAMVKGILHSLKWKPESKTRQAKIEKCFSNAQFTTWLAAYGYEKD
jgi:hypothetical protein